jgi:2-polyprenyl-6-methoxyphenol hydroxylase-like FAD-dependent oxidoreductase
MAANGLSQLRSGCSVTRLSENKEWTYCEYTDSEGNTRRIRSKFFVGADGKTGYTRKKYLEPKGIQMERAHKYVHRTVEIHILLTSYL